MRPQPVLTKAPPSTKRVDRQPRGADPDQPSGLWGGWLSLSTPPVHPGPLSARAREHLRLVRLLSALQLTAIGLMFILIPRGFLPVFDPGTTFGVLAFGIIVVISIIINRVGYLRTAAVIYVSGLLLAIAGSQLFTPSGTISLQDLAGYDFLVIPVIIAGAIFPRRTPLLVTIACVVFIVLDLGLAIHGPNLQAFLPPSTVPFVNIYPVAIYPIVLLFVVAVIITIFANSVARALAEADRTKELEEAYELLAEQEASLERAVKDIQFVISRIANGDASARASVAQENPLMPLAVSLNLLLERQSGRTGTTGTHEELDGQIRLLGGYIAELGNGNLRLPAPLQRPGRLAPIAFSVEQWRLNLTGVLHQQRAMLEQLHFENARIAAEASRLGEYSPANDELAANFRQSTETIERLVAQLAQFGGRASAPGAVLLSSAR